MFADVWYGYTSNERCAPPNPLASDDPRLTRAPVACRCSRDGQAGHRAHPQDSHDPQPRAVHRRACLESNLAFECQHIIHSIQAAGVRKWVALQEGAATRPAG